MKVKLIILLIIIIMHTGCMNRETRFIATLRIETHMNEIGKRVIDNVEIVEGEGFDKGEVQCIRNEVITIEENDLKIINEVRYTIYYFRKKDLSLGIEIKWVKSEPEYIFIKEADMVIVTTGTLKITFTSQNFREGSIRLSALQWDYIGRLNLEDIEMGTCNIKVFVNFSEEILIVELNGIELCIVDLERSNIRPANGNSPTPPPTLILNIK